MDASSPPGLRPFEFQPRDDFATSSVRPAAYAGSAYYADPEMLARYIDEVCLGQARDVALPEGQAIALVSPHIDPWRGAVGYGHAYGALAKALSPDVDTFVVFGTAHSPMREPFALCRKAFATPLGTVPADLETIDALADRADGFDPYADERNHLREHSLEFQAVFLKHVLGGRRFRIVPVLAGLGVAQMTGVSPDADERVARFLDAIRGLVEARPGRVVFVAGADLAHVGPRFGDPRPYDTAQRSWLRRQDRASLDRAAGGDWEGFWAHVIRNLDERRV
jgi:AmmeMemoRadiSam system protein B